MKHVVVYILIVSGLAMLVWAYLAAAAFNAGITANTTDAEVISATALFMLKQAISYVLLAGAWLRQGSEYLLGKILAVAMMCYSVNNLLDEVSGHSLTMDWTEYVTAIIILITTTVTLTRVWMRKRSQTNY